MRLEINAGGMDSFFNGVSSFITVGINNATSDSLITSFQKVSNKTCGISGGVGTLNTALLYINTRKTAEESRKIAVQNVRGKTDRFIRTSVRVDKSVAGIVKNSTEAFYRTNRWLRPPAPPSDWDRFCGGVGGTISSFCSSVGDVINSIGDVVGKVGKFFQSVGEDFLIVMKGIKEWVVTHWKEILIVGTAAVVIVAAVLLSVGTGGLMSAVFVALIGASVGALCGAGGQFFSDVLSMTARQKQGLSNWQTYVGAMVGGAIGGAITAACANPAIGATIGGATGGAMSKFVGGKLEGKTVDELLPDMAFSAALGAAIGPIANRLFGKSFPSITGGQNGLSAVYKSGMTKILNGNATEMSWNVFFKGTAAKFLGDLYKNSLKWGVKSIFT